MTKKRRYFVSYSHTLPPNASGFGSAVINVEDNFIVENVIKLIAEDLPTGSHVIILNFFELKEYERYSL